MTVPHATFTTILTLFAAAACGPNISSSDGFGETEGELLPIPGEDVTCRDHGTAIRCWVDWPTGGHAQVFLDCERQALVDANVWTSAYDPEPGVDPDLDWWGDSVLCHNFTASTLRACFYESVHVLLSLTADGWEPILDPTIEDYPEVDPPCGDDPVAGDGDGDPGETCDYLGCPCAAGGCVENLVCDLSEHCSPCPPGSPGCPCGASGYCEVGQCTQGQDIDGVSWSICYPADLLSCGSGSCPGDAHCTDALQCAWAD